MQRLCLPPFSLRLRACARLPVLLPSLWPTRLTSPPLRICALAFLRRQGERSRPMRVGALLRQRALTFRALITFGAEPPTSSAPPLPVTPPLLRLMLLRLGPELPLRRVGPSKRVTGQLRALWPLFRPASWQLPLFVERRWLATLLASGLLLQQRLRRACVATRARVLLPWRARQRALFPTAVRHAVVVAAVVRELLVVLSWR